MKSDSWTVHKFGGSSLKDEAAFRRVAAILSARRSRRQAVVVSAVGGVTDMLLNAIGAAAQREAGYKDLLGLLLERHQGLASALLGDASRDAYLDELKADLDDVHDICRATSLMGTASTTALDIVSGCGELWSARLLSLFLQQEWQQERWPVRWLDARRVVTVEHGELAPIVDWPVSERRLATELDAETEGTVIITGFIAERGDGIQTTLGRDGSDFSASIFGALLDAAQIHIWTDVDGVMSADPNQVSDARLIDELSYNEAMELAYFGARVLHPQTMAPAVRKNIPIYIRNSYAPEGKGTRIGAVSGDGAAIKGITTIDNVAVLNLEGSGMIGVPGTAQRLFAALGHVGVSVVMISQGSSEHSICFAVPQADAGAAERAVRSTFAAELAQGQIQDVDVTSGLSIIAVVGDEMEGSLGVAAKLFESLASAGINVRAIAQGSSERNISAVIDGREAARALQAVHSGFYLSPQTLSIGVIGCGTVGQVFLDQLRDQADTLLNEFDVDLRVRALANSRCMHLEPGSVQLAGWRDALSGARTPLDMNAFADFVQSDHLPHAVIVDCTADASVAANYLDWLNRGIHVITPNKKAGSAELEYYRQLRRQSRDGEARFLYETTVGAGLPIIQTLRDLIQTGDHIRNIEGILSGTLAYLFNVYDGAQPFSALVSEARRLGFTEPDPRDDLSGMDVARKLVILGREIGLPLSLEDVQVESLVPQSLRDCSVDEFLVRYAEFDAAMQQRFADAAGAGKVLRYVGRLNAAGHATVGLESVTAQHALAVIHLSDNIVQFQTDRYSDNPLIVQGPGAGPAVTAGGVFADLLRLAANLGARL